ncbi:2-amino-4-hydroxy-6-hydroxymethyldihydropteridine diphosphokinase [Pseudothermotoga elfii]|uniref:2-amino-4-hydroxy-6- hydroxymethyldihydropteridine diphosphokinase n=1 Tax=Pseudothermotoga elfii TaxID=38322 RepID=UPI0003F56C83|nr:2-amino-4-hydroxy-6-hydroxymethyldihydropteridine diphosphokinase [Pseudothermotoga elfii]
MIVGIGIDVVKIDRVELSLSKRILGPSEQLEFESIKDKKTYLAARFAAKEAFFKAIGTGVKNYSFTDIEIIHNHAGKPLLLFHRDFYFNFAHISITHDFVAAAQIILEKRPGNVYIGVGSNLEDRLKNIQEACNLMESRKIKIIKKSSIYETDPYGVKDQPDFYNCVLEVDTDFSVEELLNMLLKIEQEMGRKREKKWGPRIIDLDILMYGNTVYKLPDLSVPHYDLINRQFVIVPLLEIKAIDHPIYGELKNFVGERRDWRLVTKNW